MHKLLLRVCRACLRYIACIIAPSDQLFVVCNSVSCVMLNINKGQEIEGIDHAAYFHIYDTVVCILHLFLVLGQRKFI